MTRVLMVTTHAYDTRIGPPPLPAGAGPHAEWVPHYDTVHKVGPSLAILWSITFTPPPAPSP